MHLEGLRYDVTPPGMHYLVIHFDIPPADEAAWTVEVDGLVERALSLSVDDLRSRPAVTRPVTMECAGNGRTLMPPRAESQPWLLEAIGNAEWTGTPLPPILEEAGLQPDAIELVFTATTGSRATSSRTTSGASRSPTSCETRSCWRTR